MKPSIKETVGIYFEQINSGTMDLSELRMTLQSKDYDTHEIDIIVNRIDRNVIRAAALNNQRLNGKNLMIVGLLIMIAGLVITFATYTGFVDLGNIFIVAYGPVLGGLVMALIGKMQMDR